MTCSSIHLLPVFFYKIDFQKLPLSESKDTNLWSEILTIDYRLPQRWGMGKTAKEVQTSNYKINWLSEWKYSIENITSNIISWYSTGVTTLNHGGHLIIHIIVESLCCASEANTVYQLYFNTKRKKHLKKITTVFIAI